MIWQLGGTQSPQHSDVEVPLHTILLEGEPAPLPKSDKSEKNKISAGTMIRPRDFPYQKITPYRLINSGWYLERKNLEVSDSTLLFELDLGLINHLSQLSTNKKVTTAPPKKKKNKWIPKMMGVGKGGSFQIWPFLVWWVYIQDVCSQTTIQIRDWTTHNKNNKQLNLPPRSGLQHQPSCIFLKKTNFLCLTGAVFGFGSDILILHLLDIYVIQ